MTGAELRAEPAEVSRGGEVHLVGHGFPPARLEGDQAYDAFVRVVIRYDWTRTVVVDGEPTELRDTRLESIKSAVGWDGHPAFAAGDVDLTVRAEIPGTAYVTVWDWAETEQLAECAFVVTEEG